MTTKEMFDWLETYPGSNYDPEFEPIADSENSVFVVRFWDVTEEEN